MSDQPFPLGRIVQHDVRSLDFPAPMAAAPIRSKSWSHYGGILNQGQVGSCTGNAMAGAVNTVPLRKANRRLLVESDAVELYSMATTMDDAPGSYPPDDTGSSGLAVSKAAVQKGYITSYNHAFGLDHALAALQTGPVIVGTNWYADMFKPNSQGFVTPTGSVVGGHEYLVYAVNTTSRYVTAINSWGAAWGLKGCFRISYDVFAQLLNEQGDVVQPVA